MPDLKSKSARVPGPFTLGEARNYGDPVIKHEGVSLGMLIDTVSDASVKEIITLLNKGTHYDGLLAALKEAQADYASAASVARTAAEAAQNHAERMRYRERLGQLENTAERFSQVIAGAEGGEHG